MKALLYLVLLALLASVVRQWPFLWELGVLGVIGGTWWLFFREPPAADD